MNVEPRLKDVGAVVGDFSRPFRRCFFQQGQKLEMELCAQQNIKIFRPPKKTRSPVVPFNPFFGGRVPLLK